MCTEAEALAGQYDDFILEAEDFVNEVKYELRRDAAIYAVNKKKRVKDLCICAGPKCVRSFVKKSYQQAFCKTKCKDQFWNRVRFWKNDLKVQMLVEKIDELNYGENLY